MLGPELASTPGDTTAAYRDISILNPDSVVEDVDEHVHLVSTCDAESKPIPGSHGTSPALAGNEECALDGALSSAINSNVPPGDKVNADDNQVACNLPEAGECRFEQHVGQVLSLRAETVAASRQEAGGARGSTEKEEKTRALSFTDIDIPMCIGT